MYKAAVNNKLFEIDLIDNNFAVNGQSTTWDIVKAADGGFHILYENKSFNAEIVKADLTTKTFILKINNHLHTVEVKDKFDLLLEKMGMSNASAGKVSNVKAPMPGLIIDLKVKDGDLVKAGDPLLILEAMKMENIIKATGEATVKSVKIKKGDTAEKGQVLIEF